MSTNSPEEKSVWSAKPFITHDGPDEQGVRAEVKVNKGYGLIKEIKESDSGKACQIIFDTGHKKFFLSGWAPKTDPVVPLVEKARDEGFPIYFRIETRRKPTDGDGKTIPRDTPILDLCDTADNSREHCVKSIAAVRFDEADEWTRSPKAVTNFSEDPTGGPGLYDASALSPTELRKASQQGGGNGGGSAPAHYSEAGEGTPFTLFLYNQGSEKVVNPGSAAVAVPLNVFSFVTEYLQDKPLPEGERDKLLFKATKLVLTLCNDLQRGIFAGKLAHPDLGASSHTRARALVFDALKNDFPLELSHITDASAAKEWHDEAYRKLLKKWQWSIKETATLMNLFPSE